MAAELQLGAGGSEPLEEEVEFLQLENGFLASLLRRLAPGLLESGGANGDDRAGDGRPGWEPLLMAEKHELLVAEAAATYQEIERVQAEGELELACLQAGVADAAGQQAAETARDVAALLSLLRLPLPPAAEAACALGAAVMSAAAASSTGLHAPAAPGKGAAQPAAGAEPAVEAQPAAGAEPAVADAPRGCEADAHVSNADKPSSAPSEAASKLPPPLLLPTAKQLAKADLHLVKLAQFLEDVLARHDANAESYQMRSELLQNSLARAEVALSSRASLGSMLTKFDFDAQRIEHSQAEAALAAASAEAVALKAQVVATAEQLAEHRSALAAASSAAGALARQAGVREQQVAALAGETAKVQRECAALERECKQLREQRQQQGSTDKMGSSCSTGSASNGGRSGQPTIVEYMRIKNACSEVSKRIADWQRKLEMQAGRRGAAASRSG